MTHARSSIFPLALALVYIGILAGLATGVAVVWRGFDHEAKVAVQQSRFESAMIGLSEYNDAANQAAHEAVANPTPQLQARYERTIGKLQAAIRDVEASYLDALNPLWLRPALETGAKLRSTEQRAIAMAAKGQAPQAMTILGAIEFDQKENAIRLQLREVLVRARTAYEDVRASSRDGLRILVGSLAAVFAVVFGVLFLYIFVARRQQLAIAAAGTQLAKVNADLESRVRERTAVLESEQRRFKDFAEITSDWFWETDAECKVRSVSEGFAQSVGIDGDAFVGRYLFDLNPSEQHPSQMNEWTSYVETKCEIRNMNIRIQSHARGKVYMRLAGRPVLDATGIFTGYRGTAVDITSGLARAREAAQGQKMQALGTMAAGLAHEFNNILAIVLGYAESLRGDLRHHPEALAQIEQIAEAGRRGSNLTKSLLSFGRTSKVQPNEIFNARAMSVDLPVLLKPLLGPAHKLEIKATDQPLWVNGDHDLLLQCIVNLVVNARDAMPIGGKVAVSFAVEQAGSERLARARLPGTRDYVRIQATDTGSGMSRKTLEKIFDPFFTTKEVGKGTGLGLSLLFSFVKNLQGHVDVESEPGKGTTFTILLPLSAAPVVQKFSSGQLTSPDFSGLRVLLVDDEPQLCTVFSMMLKNLGCEVISHTDPNAALSVVDDESQKIDVIVSDVLMPDMSGFKFAELAQSLRKVDVLFITGQPERAGEEGSDMPKNAKLLRKPFDKNQLANALRDLLQAQAAA